MRATRRRDGRARPSRDGPAGGLLLGMGIVRGVMGLVGIFIRAIVSMVVRSPMGGNSSAGNSLEWESINWGILFGVVLSGLTLISGGPLLLGGGINSLLQPAGFAVASPVLVLTYPTVIVHAL